MIRFIPLQTQLMCVSSVGLCAESPAAAANSRKIIYRIHNFPTRSFSWVFFRWSLAVVVFDIVLVFVAHIFSRSVDTVLTARPPILSWLQAECVYLFVLFKTELFVCWLKISATSHTDQFKKKKKTKSYRFGFYKLLFVLFFNLYIPFWFLWFSWHLNGLLFLVKISKENCVPACVLVCSESKETREGI